MTPHRIANIEPERRGEFRHRFDYFSSHATIFSGSIKFVTDVTDVAGTCSKMFKMNVPFCHRRPQRQRC